MAYKKLSEATLVESVVEETNVLIEENDEIKRVSASLFKPDYSEIINAPISEDIAEEVNVLIEENGEIKRAPVSKMNFSSGDIVIELVEDVVNKTLTYNNKTISYFGSDGSEIKYLNSKEEVLDIINYVKDQPVIKFVVKDYDNNILVCYNYDYNETGNYPYIRFGELSVFQIEEL